MRARITAIVICAAALQATACDQEARYRGDGKFSDFGPQTAHERYVVDLGPIDLSRANKQSFKMLGLPSTELTVGLRQVDVSAGCDATALSSVRVRLEVRGADRAVVVSEEGPLSTWTSSPSLLYRRGVELQEPSGGGSVQLVRTGVRASDGWGTYFTPKPSETYIASSEVLDARGASGCESSLVVLGGGWK